VITCLLRPAMGRCSWSRSMQREATLLGVALLLLYQSHMGVAQPALLAVANWSASHRRESALDLSGSDPNALSFGACSDN